MIGNADIENALKSNIKEGFDKTVLSEAIAKAKEIDMFPDLIKKAEELIFDKESKDFCMNLRRQVYFKNKEEIDKAKDDVEKF